MPDNDLHRGNTRDRTKRDLDRLDRRKDASLASSIALIGSVGWPIVLLGAGGGLLGRYLDALWGLGVAGTLSLVLLGTALGSYVAYRSLKGRQE